MNYNLAHKGLVLFSIKVHLNFIVYVKTKFFLKNVSFVFYLVVIIKETHCTVKILTLDLNEMSVFYGLSLGHCLIQF